MAGAIRIIDGIKYKEVNRKARAGEKIVIREGYELEHIYGPGDILTVENPDRWSDDCGLTPVEFNLGLNHDEYNVLEPVDALGTSNLLGIIADLTACVEKLTEEVRELRKFNDQ